MLFDQIKPFVRYTRFQTIDEYTGYKTRMGYDCRLFYAMSGEGELKIRDIVYKMQAGNLAIINSGVAYQPCSVHEKRVQYVTINFDYTQGFAHIKLPVQPLSPVDFRKENILSHAVFEDTLLFSESCYFSNMFHAGTLAQQIATENQRKLLGYQTKINGLMGELLTECLRADASYSDTSKLKSVIEFIHKKYAYPLSNAEIAAEFGYHPNYLSSLFRRITGKSLYQYLLSVRIAKATELLESTDYTIGKIAELTGFDHISNFSAAFRKIMQYTPSQYRNSRYMM